jgi:DNA-binding GntR family transcriptional regulator
MRAQNDLTRFLFSCTLSTEITMGNETFLLSPIEGLETVKGRVVKLLIAAIFEGKIKPGEKLKESVLAKQLGVSRSPIREALQQLQEQGLVINTPRRGTVVVKLEEEDIQKINSFRLIAEAEALRLARMRATPEDKNRLKEIIAKMEGVDQLPWSEAARIDFEFHRAIWSISHNEYLAHALEVVTAPLFAHGVLQKLRTDSQTLRQDSHRPLIDYILGKSTQSAEEVMLQHLSIRHSDPAKFSSLAGKRSGQLPGDH